MWLKYLVLRLRGLGKKERQAVNQVIEITPKEVIARTQKGEKLAFLDVREPYEREAGKIDDSTFIPMGEVKDRLGELNKQQPWVVYCAVGGRSRVIAGYMVGQGFKDVYNLAGGIHAWTRDIGSNCSGH